MCMGVMCVRTSWGGPRRSEVSMGVYDVLISNTYHTRTHWGKSVKVHSEPHFYNVTSDPLLLVYL